MKPKRAARRGWVVGVNAPGYLPDQEPVICATFEQAFLELQAELVRTREALWPDDGPEGLAADDRLDQAADATCAQIREAPGQPFSVQAFGLAHWIERG